MLHGSRRFSTKTQRNLCKQLRYKCSSTETNNQMRHVDVVLILGSMQPNYNAYTFFGRGNTATIHSTQNMSIHNDIHHEYVYCPQ